MRLRRGCSGREGCLPLPVPASRKKSSPVAGRRFADELPLTVSTATWIKIVWLVAGGWWLALIPPM